MNYIDRLIKYIKIDTQADPNSDTTPSSIKQFDLANVLKDELIELGFDDVYLDEKCYLYAKLKANTDKNVKRVGFIAHMDTSYDFVSSPVNCRIVKDYDGKDIILNDERKIDLINFPQFSNYIGNDILVGDGNSLLGVDDKAGIVAIIEAFKKIKESNIEHGDISLCFTCDEEIGRGADFFDLDRFNCDFAYTIDGGEIKDIENENFNAASCEVVIYGNMIHPGSAKNKMINAISVAKEFDDLLPKMARPEYTEGYEGFNHLMNFDGRVDKTVLNYIIRNHDSKKFIEQKEMFITIKDFLSKKYNTNIEVSIKDSYKNMYDVLKDKPEVLGFAIKALDNLGIKSNLLPIRGGTDGASLTFKGLPTPNLGAGGGNFHGPYEYCVLNQLEKSIDMIVEIVKEVYKK